MGQFTERDGPGAMAPRAIVAVLGTAEASPAVVFREGTARLRLFNQSASFGPFARVGVALDEVPADALCVVHERHLSLSGEEIGGRQTAVLAEDCDVAQWLSEVLERARECGTICGVVSAVRGDEAFSFAVLAALQTLSRRLADAPPAKRRNASLPSGTSRGVETDGLDALYAEAAALHDDARTAHENVSSALRRMRKAVSRRLDGLVAGLRLSLAEQSAAASGDSCPDCALLEAETFELRRLAEEAEARILGFVRGAKESSDALAANYSAAVNELREAAAVATADREEAEEKLREYEVAAEERIAVLEVESSRLRDDAERLGAAAEVANGEVLRLRAEDVEKAARILSLEISLSERNNALRQASSDVAELMAAMRARDDSIASTCSELESVRMEHDSLKCEHAECAVSMQQMRSEAVRLRTSLAERCSALGAAAAESDEAARDAEHRLARASDALGASRARVQALCAELSAMSASASDGAALQSRLGTTCVALGCALERIAAARGVSASEMRAALAELCGKSLFSDENARSEDKILCSHLDEVSRVERRILRTLRPQ